MYFSLESSQGHFRDFLFRFLDPGKKAPLSFLGTLKASTGKVNVGLSPPPPPPPPNFETGALSDSYFCPRSLSSIYCPRLLPLLFPQPAAIKINYRQRKRRPPSPHFGFATPRALFCVWEKAGERRHHPISPFHFLIFSTSIFTWPYVPPNAKATGIRSHLFVLPHALFGTHCGFAHRHTTNDRKKM